MKTTTIECAQCEKLFDAVVGINGQCMCGQEYRWYTQYVEDELGSNSFEEVYAVYFP
jgi:hypothetical protein